MASKVMWASIGAASVAAASFIFGAVLNPPLEELGTHLKNKWIRDKAISIEVCAPLERATRVLRAYDKSTGNDLLVKKFEIDDLNVSTIKVMNNTNNALTNVVLSIVPLLDHDKQRVDYIDTEVATNAVDARNDFEIDFNKSRLTRRISIDRLASGDGIVISDTLRGPIDQQVELSSDEHPVRKTFPRGCDQFGEIESQQGTWYGIYKMNDGSCTENDGSHRCKNEWSMSREFTELMHNGAVIEITQIINDKVMIVVDATSELVVGSDPAMYKMKTETKYNSKDE